MKIERKVKKLETKIDKIKRDMLSLYRRKGGDEDVISLLKKKSIKLDKLTEEYNKMAMKIVDGKLVNSDKEPKKETEEELKEKIEARKVEMEAMENREIDNMLKRTNEELEEDVYPQRNRYTGKVPQFTREQLDLLRQQEIDRENTLLKNQELLEARAIEEAQKKALEDSKEPQIVNVKITLFPNIEIPVAIKEQEVERFLNDINEAINSQTIMLIGHVTLNGKYIIKHEFV